LRVIGSGFVIKTVHTTFVRKAGGFMGSGARSGGFLRAGGSAAAMADTHPFQKKVA